MSTNGMSMATSSQSKTEIVKKEWSAADVFRLIKVFRESPELWDRESRNCGKAGKALVFQRIAKQLNTDAVFVARKIHNLRTQYNEEMRKMERTIDLAPEERYISKWMYLKSLSFLERRRRDNVDAINMDDGNSFEYISLEDSNLEIADDKANIQCHPGVQFYMQEQSQENLSNLSEHSTSHSFDSTHEHNTEFHLQTEPLTEQMPTTTNLDSRKRQVSWPAEEDDYSIFSAFVTSEMRGLKYEKIRKKLKCDIVRAILNAIETEQEMENGNNTLMEAQM